MLHELDQPTLVEVMVSRRAGVSDFGGEVSATNAQLTDPGIR
jgi:hypothetical protein